MRAVVVILVMIESVAWAEDPLTRVRDAIAASDYAAARDEIVTVRDAGGCSPEQTAELLQLTGMVEAALDHRDAATEAFSRLIALSPRAALPPGMSPKITRPFETAALSFMNREPLAVQVATSGDPPTLTAIVVSDPLHMIAKLRVAYTADGGAEHVSEAEIHERIDIVLPGKRIAVRLTVLDEHGNRLREYGVTEPIVIVADPPPPVAAPVASARAGARPLYRGWWPYAAAAVAIGGATAYFGWSAYSAASDLQELNNRSTEHSWREARALRDRGRRDTMLANIGLAATGAFAITAGVLFALRPRGTEPRVMAAPLRGGGELALQGSF